MSKKILVTLYGSDVAPRFDLATEIWLGSTGERNIVEDERTIVLPHASAEELCHLILREHVDVVICCGIEEEYFEYLHWKRIEVFDSVVGRRRDVVNAYLAKTLRPGAVLVPCDT